MGSIDIPDTVRFYNPDKRVRDHNINRMKEYCFRHAVIAATEGEDIQTDLMEKFTGHSCDECMGNEEAEKP